MQRKKRKNMRDRTFISFDWALKRLLRDKANFGVLEGFVSTILDKPGLLSGHYRHS